MDPEFAAAFETQATQVNAVWDVSEDNSGKSPAAILRERFNNLLKGYRDYHTERLPPASTYTVLETLVPVEGGEIRVRCVTPTAEDEEKTFPVLVWFHGGGWVFGDIENDDSQLRRVSVESQICTVNVEYRHAPEHLFPTGVTDSLEAVKWVVENAPSVRVDVLKGLILGGHSAGANIAAVLAHVVRDDAFFEGRPVTGHYLREPPVLHPDAWPEEYKAELLSLEEFRDSPLLGRDSFIQLCELTQAPPTDPRFSVLLFPSHAGVAPTFVSYNGQDPLRDDDRLYERVLRESGVKVKGVCYPGVPHAFYNMCPGISLSLKMYQDMKDALGWLLSGAL